MRKEEVRKDLAPWHSEGVYGIGADPNLQVREFLDGGGQMVIVPVGSTEDHGDHGPLWTDVYIPTEVAKAAAPELQALG